MASVDDRIVAMKFDNQAFEQKLSTTIASLDKLKGSLDFANSKRGLDDLSTASRNFNLEGIASAVDGISGKFSAMGVVAFSVISSIATKAFEAGVQIVKSLSLDQVLSGFHEYETNMNAIQTVLSNTKQDGTTLNDVNAALQQLNDYSDQTIYNFSQMAKNVGTFTAAGVGLDASVTAIKGIANLAAVSGSNADQASTAMYQLSQALASGTVKLIDWNSIVNAGMGGEVFQKALFETGKSLKTIKGVGLETTFDDWKKAGNTFRDSLQDGWITADVLTNTLQGFTGDLTDAQLKSMGYNAEQIKQIQEMGVTAKDAATKVKTLSQLISTVKESIGSGWTKTFQTIFGDFDEAKGLFTDINNTLGAMVSASANARNSVLEGWKEMTGRTVLIEALKNAFNGVLAILKPIREAFADIFPPLTSLRLFELTEKLRDLTAALTPTPVVADLLKRAFRGIFALFSIGYNIVKGIIGLFVDLFQSFADENPHTGILGFFARLGDTIYFLKNRLVNAGGIEEFFKNLSQTLKEMYSNARFYLDAFMAKVAEVIDYFMVGFTDQGTNEGSGILLFANRVGMAFNDIVDWIQAVIKWLRNLGDSTNIDGVSEGLGRMGDRLSWLVGLGELLAGVFGAVIKAVGEFIGFIKDKFSDVPQAIADVFAKTDYSTVLDTVNVGLFGGLVLLTKKFFDGFDVVKGIGKNISKSFQELTGTLKAMQTDIKAEALLRIAEATGLLVAAMVVLSLMDSGALTKAMTAMAIGFGQLVGVMALLDQISQGITGASKMTILAVGMIALAGAMTILAVAVKILSTMSWAELAKGLTAVTVLLGVLAVAIKPLSDNSGGMISTGIGLMAVATALNILALAVKSFAQMEWESMAQGMLGVAAGLTALTIAVKNLPDNMVGKGVGLIAVAVALNILALAVKSFAQMEWESMGQGLVGIGVALAVVAGAMHLMPPGLAAQGAGLALIGVGLTAVSKAVISLSGLSWAQMAKGLAGIAGVLTVLAVASAVMEGTIAGAIAIGIMALSMGKLAKALKDFASLKWSELLKGLAGIAAVLAVLAVSALLIEPALPALLLLGVALTLVGAGFALFGVGANLVATAFAIIATAGTEGVATLIAVLDALIGHLPAIIVAFGDGILALARKIIDALPGIIAGMDDVITALLQLIIDSMPKLAETFKVFILTALQTIADLTPDIIATGLKMLLDLLKGIRDNIGEVTTTVIEIILEFIAAVTKKIPDIVAAGLGILVALLQGIADNIAKVTAAAGNIITSFIQGISDAQQKIITSGVQALLKFLEGIVTAIPLIAGTITKVVVAIIKAIGEEVPHIVDAGFKMIIALFDGISKAIKDNAEKVGASLAGLAEAFALGIGDALKGAIKKIANDLFPGLGTVVSAVLDFFGIKSPSKLFYDIGDNLMLGFGSGIFENLNRPIDALEGGNKLILNTMTDTMSKISDALDTNMDMQPTITPVLDLTNVQNGANQLSDILAVGSTVAADISSNQIQLLTASKTAQDASFVDQASIAPREIKFEQNNYSPEALSLADIYRQTRNQIALAKEELAVL